MIGRNRITLLLIMLLSVGLFSAQAAQDQRQSDDKPAVVKAVAPTSYPATALVAQAEGKVVVEVKIDVAGKVTSARAVEGHESLRKAAEETAKQWQFESANGSRQRVAHLTFIYRVASRFFNNPLMPNKEEVIFSPPYQVEVTFQPPAMTGALIY